MRTRVSETSMHICLGGMRLRAGDMDGPGNGMDGSNGKADHSRESWQTLQRCQTVLKQWCGHILSAYWGCKSHQENEKVLI